MSFKRVNFLRLLTVTGLVASVVLFVVLWFRMITSPVQRTGADFIAFYSAGRIMLSGDRAGVFDLHTQLIEEERILGFPISPQDLAPFIHPPFILPILASFSILQYLQAFLSWATLLYLFYFLNALIMIRTLPHLHDDKVLCLGVLLFFPAFVSVLNGQDTAVLLLGASLWIYGLLINKDRLAGLGLALTTIRPQIGILLALPFLFQRRKVFLWFCMGALSLATLSVFLVGIQGVQNFINILGISANGVGYKTNQSAMFNFIGLLYRLVPEISSDFAGWVGWIVYVLAIIILCKIWARNRYIEEKHLGLAVLLGIIASPHLHYHDLALLLVPIICLLSVLKKRNFLPDHFIAVIPLGISWLLILSYTLPALKYSVPYLLGLALAIVLWHPDVISTFKGKNHGIIS